MSRYVDIGKLTQEVLSSVEEEQREKTASDSETNLKTEIGDAIKAAANNIRDYEDTDVTNVDLKTVMEGTKIAIFGGSTTGAQMAGGLGGTGAGALGGAAAGAALGTMAMPGVGTALGGLAGGLMGGRAGGAAGSNLAQGASNMMQPGAVQPTQAGQPGQQMRTASALGDELRKLATQIREQGTNNEEIRLTKAAQMLTAAVGLGHLTEGLQ